MQYCTSCYVLSYSVLIVYCATMNSIIKIVYNAIAVREISLYLFLNALSTVQQLTVCSDSRICNVENRVRGHSSYPRDNNIGLLCHQKSYILVLRCSML